MTTEEKLFRKHIRQMLDLLESHYHAAIQEVTLVLPTVKYKGGIFRVRDYPNLQQAIQKALKNLNTKIYATVITSMETAWNMSNKKNDALVDKRLNGKKPTAPAAELLYNPNKAARDAVKARIKKGMNLSERVWKRTKAYRHELEKGLVVGISEGQSAAEIARDLKQYLNEPDRLFRKVRDSKGNFRLSEAAQAYKPGTGVYRSSYKNALRLTASETNISYRTSDFVRWQQLTFVIGIEVRTSDSHPKFDICDQMKGRYPKSFKFVGFHTRCLCYAVAILMSDEEYDKYEDFILGLSDKPPTVKGIEDIPAGAKNWIQKNADKLTNPKTQPYFVSDNMPFVKEYLK